MASESRTKAHGAARVQVTLEIDTGSAWGDDCSLGQVFDQAARETVERIRNKLHPTDVRIIGEPIVTTFIVKR